MFEKLDDINWKELHAEKVPELIRSLPAANEDNQDDLLNELFEITYGGGMPHRFASLHIIPFLIELLPLVKFEIKGELLNLLSYCAINISGLTLKHPNYEISFQCHEAVRKGLNAYLEIAKGKHERIYPITNLFYALPKDAKRTVPVLISLRDAQDDEHLKAYITLTMSHLVGENPIFSDSEKRQYLTLLQDWFKEETSSSVKMWVGVAIIDITKDATPQEIVDYIRSSLTPENIWAFLGNAYSDLAQHLLKLDFERGIATIADLLKVTPSESAIATIIYWLLDLGFKVDPKVKARLDETSVLHYAATQKQNLQNVLGPELQARLKPVEKLTSAQRQIIEAILNTQRFWEMEGNLLEFYGLPTSREELLKLFSDSQAETSSTQ